MTSRHFPLPDSVRGGRKPTTDDSYVVFRSSSKVNETHENSVTGIRVVVISCLGEPFKEKGRHVTVTMLYGDRTKIFLLETILFF